MNKRTLVAILLMSSSSAALASPGIFAGLAYTFDQSSGGLGLTLKVLSNNKEDNAVVGAGVTYYPMLNSNKFGVDAGVGYVFKDAAVTVGWDFLHSPQVAVGYINSKSDKPAATPTPGPSPE